MYTTFVKLLSRRQVLMDAKYKNGSELTMKEITGKDENQDAGFISLVMF